MLVLLQVPCQLPDTPCEKSDLNLRRTGVCGVCTEFFDDLLSLILIQPCPFAPASLFFSLGIIA